MGVAYFLGVVLLLVVALWRDDVRFYKRMMKDERRAETAHRLRMCRLAVEAGYMAGWREAREGVGYDGKDRFMAKYDAEWGES